MPVPRMRGDEPTGRRATPDRPQHLFPACAGMNRSCSEGHGARITLFPACAGMNRLWSSLTSMSVPRMRMKIGAIVRALCSPHARG